MSRLTTRFLGSLLKNPVMTASGTFGYGREYDAYYDPSILGAIISKGLTLHPKEGNPGQRLQETKGGLLNSIGLENPSVAGFLKKEYPEMKAIGTDIGVNLGGNTLAEYIEGAKLLEEAEIAFLELNISCPNVKEGGMAFGVDKKMAALVTKEVKRHTRHKLMVKLSPNVTDIGEMAKVCEAEGADAISLVNTFQGMAVNVNKRKAVFANIYAGLSGPAIKPLALRMVHEVAKAVKIPVVGLGGIMDTEDVLAFLMVGATAVQLGTGHFVNPRLGQEVIEGLLAYCEQEGLHQIEEIRGIV